MICIHMGGSNGSYNQMQHLRSRSTSTTSTTTSFLPFLCRISIKDVVKISQTSPCPKKNDPSSPKVSCIGQIKHHHHHNNNNNNKLNLIIPTTTTTTGKPKYTKLKKLFSGRNLLMTTPTTTKCSRVNDSKIPKIESRDQRRSAKFNHQHHHHHNGGYNDSCAVVVPVNLAELDPPLPVMKTPCRRRGEEEGGSLWKRRGGGGGILGSLEIQQIQLPNRSPTTLLLQPSSVS